jgi:hypothetical protein
VAHFSGDKNMEPVIEAALRDAAVKAFAVDADIVTLPEFGDAVAAVTVENGEVDSASLNAAISTMRALKPELFRPWDALSDQDFEKRERAFREGLFRARSLGPSPVPKDFDFGSLSPEEFDKADRYMRGVSNDDSVFRKARAS